MKKRTTAEKKYLKASVGSKALNVGTFLCPVIPGIVITAVNAEEWFAEKPWSIGLGFASLLLTIVIAVFGVLKKNETIAKAISKIWGLVVLFACLGVTFVFLASVANNLGMMFLATAGGLVGSCVCNEVDKKLVQPEREYQRSIIDGAGINRKQLAREQKKLNDIKKAREEAENIGGIL